MVLLLVCRFGFVCRSEASRASSAGNRIAALFNLKQRPDQRNEHEESLRGTDT
jgi:hypothetical protein